MQTHSKRSRFYYSQTIGRALVNAGDVRLMASPPGQKNF